MKTKLSTASLRLTEITPRAKFGNQKNDSNRKSSIQLFMFACLVLCSTLTFGQEICNNGVDDDFDGLIDCFDSNCQQNIISNPSMEIYTQCSNMSTNSTLNFATGWKTAGPTGGQLMVVNPLGAPPSGIVCNSPRPAISWSPFNNMPAGSQGRAWLGMHTDFSNGFTTCGCPENAQNTLAIPTVAGNTYQFTFEATHVYEPPFVSGGSLRFYGIRPGELDYANSVLLGTVGPINNQLTWQTYSITFTTAEVFDRINLVATGMNSYLYFDNFRAAECPLPPPCTPVALCRNMTVTLNAGGTASITTADINNGSNACGGTISISQSNFNCANVGANTVTLTVTSPSGSSSCTSTVTVLSPVTASVDDYCISTTTGYGSTGIATFTATGAGGTAPYTYLWSNGATTASISVNPVVNTSYSVTATDANGCHSTLPTTVNVIVTDVTTCHPSGKKVQVCHLPPGNPANMQSICIGAPAVPAHLTGGPGHGGCYLGPCVDPCNAPVNFQRTMIMEDEHEIMIYPNPSNGIFKIEIHESDFTFEVFSMDGRILTKGEGKNGLSVFDLSNQMPGLYFVRIVADGNVSTHKIIRN